MSAQSTLVTSTNSMEGSISQTSHEPSGLHIPQMKWEVIHGWHIPFTGIPVTNTMFSTWLFMGVLFILVACVQIALRTSLFPRLRAGVLSVVAGMRGYTHAYFVSSSKTPDIQMLRLSQRLFPLLSGAFLFVLLANLFSLLLDWMVLVSKDHSLAHYLRPINSDLNTTLALALITIVISQIIAFRFRWVLVHLGWYFANFHGHGVMERSVNFFVWILHFIGEFSRVLWLSMRLFGNIFAGVVLISVMSYLTTKIAVGSIYIGQLLVLPFWLFEVFVACIQAYIFYTLMHVYFQESSQTSH